MNNQTDLESYYDDLMNELDHSSSSQGEYKEILYIERVLPYLLQEQGSVSDIDLHHFNRPHYGRIDGLGFDGDYDSPDSDPLELIILVNDFNHEDSFTDSN